MLTSLVFLGVGSGVAAVAAAAAAGTVAGLPRTMLAFAATAEAPRGLTDAVAETALRRNLMVGGILE